MRLQYSLSHHRSIMGVWCFPYDVCRCLWCGLESLVKRGAVSFIVSVFKLDKNAVSVFLYKDSGRALIDGDRRGR